MVERRPLTEGVTPPAASNMLPSAAERQFINSARSATSNEALRTAATDASGASLSTRIRPDFVALLKRASLERKLAGVQPNSLRDILEDAVGPWLKANGYLS